MRGYSLTSDDVVAATMGRWDDFAAENDGAGAMAHAVIGRPLFEMVAGPATVRFLEQTFYNSRRGQTVTGLLYRCDSPVQERLFVMQVVPLERGGLQVLHRQIRCRPLRPLPLCALGHLRYLRCSQCLSCNFGGPWVEGRRFQLPSGAMAEDAVCPACRAAAFVAEPEGQGLRPQHCG
ncbi:hypothetical protein [Pseudotabrizicola algicola]|uniref:Uncharacterized protein n=1 Tax=Pseudotabrizicola algicola TaxID=2709381 RepID=A0A6B3RQ61_9RHOB|nr:hypothetical protein [Pseudotabrizicola algicola]NEX46908.1 hypothetical protein [Pseudotabrizicola algicola]